MPLTATLIRSRDHYRLNAPYDERLHASLIEAEIGAHWRPQERHWRVPLRHAKKLMDILLPIISDNHWHWQDHTAQRLNVSLLHLFHKTDALIPFRYQADAPSLDAETHFNRLWQHLLEPSDHLKLVTSLGQEVNAAWQTLLNETDYQVAFHYYEYGLDPLLARTVTELGLNQRDLSTLVIQCAGLLDQHLRATRRFVTPPAMLGSYHPTADDFCPAPHLHLLASASAPGLESRVGVHFFTRDALEIAERLDKFQYDWLTNRLADDEKWYLNYLTRRTGSLKEVVT